MKAPRNFLVIVTEQFSDRVVGIFSKEQAFLTGLRLSSLGKTVSVFSTERPELFGGAV